MSAITAAQAEYLTKLIESSKKSINDETNARQKIHGTAAYLAMHNKRIWARIKGAQAEAAGEDVAAAKAAALIEAGERDEWDDDVNDDYWFTFYQERTRAVMDEHITEWGKMLNLDVQTLTKDEASKAIDFLQNAITMQTNLEESVIKRVIAEMIAETESAKKA